jgi:ribonuclease P protein component
VDRRAGNAVVRNRIRRRVRAALRTLAQQDRLPAGTYLVRAGAGAATSPWAVLVDDLGAAVLAAAAQP